MNDLDRLQRAKEMIYSLENKSYEEKLRDLSEFSSVVLEHQKEDGNLLSSLV